MVERNRPRNSSDAHPFRCDRCYDKNPGNRYGHYLSFVDHQALEDHLTGGGYEGGLKASILAWYHTVIGSYRQQAENDMVSISTAWAKANKQANESGYAIRNVEQAAEVINRFYEDLADLGIDRAEAVSYARKVVYTYINEAQNRTGASHGKVKSEV